MFDINLKRIVVSPNVPWIWFATFHDGRKVTFILNDSGWFVAVIVREVGR